jgi:hypothetical protein
MKKKNMSRLALGLAILSTTTSLNIANAKVISSDMEPKVVYSSVAPVRSITTNQLKPYILSDKELYGVLGDSSDEIQKLKLKSGYYVFNNEKYGIKDSNVYVMISLGQRNTTGYGIKVISVEDIEGISKITIQETKPAPDMMLGQVVTYPYIILRFAQGTPNVKVVTEDGLKLSPLVQNSKGKVKVWNPEKNKKWFISNMNMFKKTINQIRRCGVIDNVVKPEKSQANSYSISRKFENVPLFDAETNKQVATVSNGFSIPLSDIKDDKVYFSLPVTDNTSQNKVAQKQYYVPSKYLEKAYKEPFVMLMIISTDTIILKDNASIYSYDNGKKNLVMKTSEKIGPFYFIQKTDNGYQFQFANNLVYVQPEDVEYIKSNQLN